MGKLFVIMPFGPRMATGRHEQRLTDFDLLYEQVIKPAGEAAVLDVLRIDEVAIPGRISDQYLQELYSADMVLADVTLPNANVFYELGIRHAMGTGPTVLIAQEGVELPFDFREQRALFYNINSKTGLVEARSRLSDVLRSVARDAGINPVQRFLHSIGAVTSPAEDIAVFDQDFRGRIERARTANQLIAIWSWAQQFKPLPALTLATLANRLADEHEWATAEEVVRCALEVRPRDFELHRYRGWYLRNLGEPHYPAAEQAFRKALNLNPSDPETIGMLAGLFKRQERYADAVALYQQGASIAPGNYYMRINRAAMQLLAYPHEPETALGLYRDLLKELTNLSEEKKDAWTEVMCAEANFVLGDDAAAHRHFESAARITTTPTVFNSPADQVSLFGARGFRPEAAAELVAWVRPFYVQSVKPSMVAVGERSPEPSVPSNPVIIHLTDVHFGSRHGADGKLVRMHRFFEGDYDRTLEAHLLREFKSTKRHFSLDGRPIYLVASGDLTYMATLDEFEEAFQFFERLCSEMSIPKERVIFCPGNHDVNWEESKTHKARRFDEYISFLDRFYGKSFRERYPLIKWDLKVASKRDLPMDLVSLQVCPREKLLILSLNSCVYETEEHHYGYVGGQQLQNCERLLEDVELSQQFVRIAVVHHHLHPYPEPVKLESGEHWQDQSTIRDSALVEKFLENNKFDLVLHGHKHKAQLRETLIRDPSFPEGVQSLIVFGGGSCGVNSRELEHNVPNHYEVIEFVNMPRVRGAQFLRVEWRTLDVAPGADWTTPRTWNLVG